MNLLTLVAVIGAIGIGEWFEAATVSFLFALALVAAGNNDHICGLLGVADGIRDGTAAVLDELRELGVRELVMLAGDNEGTARAVAEAIGLEDFRAEFLPPEKVSAVAGLRDQL